jgi:hypothetical protein
MLALRSRLPQFVSVSKSSRRIYRLFRQGQKAMQRSMLAATENGLDNLVKKVRQDLQEKNGDEISVKGIINYVAKVAVSSISGKRSREHLLRGAEDVAGDIFKHPCDSVNSTSLLLRERAKKYTHAHARLELRFRPR